MDYYKLEEEKLEFEHYNINEEYIGQKDVLNDSNEQIYNKKLNNSIKTNSTIYINSRCENFEITFSHKDEEDSNNIKNKDLSKETIQLLQNLINLETYIISKDNKLENNYINKVNNIKELTKNIFMLEKNMNNIIKKPFMRKNENININDENIIYKDLNKINKVYTNIPNLIKTKCKNLHIY